MDLAICHRFPPAPSSAESVNPTCSGLLLRQNSLALGARPAGIRSLLLRSRRLLRKSSCPGLIFPAALCEKGAPVGNEFAIFPLPLLCLPPKFQAVRRQALLFLTH